jgi:hypothetical protein
VTQPELVVPDWVPASVAEAGRELLRTAEGREEAVIVRLLTNPEMETVWRYLMQEPGGQVGLKPSRWPKPEERQARAAEIFRAACNTRVAAFTQDRIDGFRKSVEEAVNGLELLLVIRRELWPSRITIDVTNKELAALRSIIAKCRSATEEAEKLPRIGRATEGWRQRGYLISVGDAMHKNYGRANSGICRDIASVALNKKIGIKQVREAFKQTGKLKAAQEETLGAD